MKGATLVAPFSFLRNSPQLAHVGSCPQNPLRRGTQPWEGRNILEIRRLALLGIAPFALGASLLAACGGGDGGGNGNDEDYVAAICNAGKDFSDDLFAALGDIDPDASEEEAIEAFIEPFENFANAVEDANPPSDLSDWHNDTVDTLNELVEQIKDGDLDALESDDDPFGEPPAGAQERLQAIAEDNEDCIEANFTFGDE